MLPDKNEQSGLPKAVEPNDTPTFVGAATEYADADEVPEAVSFLAKLFAGGFIASGLVIGLLVLAAVACMILIWLGFFVR